ncbi:DUF664 domain-containing protein, partial [Streptomyces sp. NPDC056367]|uniref:mycothiol transferase n=1 Tax=Streptomyces sp. NPDC056367 TaxID=3345797 RepID=UPI0035DD502F
MPRGTRSVRSFPVRPGWRDAGAVPWFPADVEEWSVRWVLLHLIEETARHGRHADTIRESLDGATLYPASGRRRAVARPVVRVPGSPRPPAGCGLRAVRCRAPLVGHGRGALADRSYAGGMATDPLLRQGPDSTDLVLRVGPAGPVWNVLA